MTRFLKEIEIDEISLVDNPANQGARVMMLKRDGGRMTIQKLVTKAESGKYATKDDVLAEFNELVSQRIAEMEDANQRARWVNGEWVNNAQLPFPMINKPVVEAEIWMSREGQRLYSLIVDLPYLAPQKREEPEPEPDPRTNTAAYKQLEAIAKTLLEQKKVKTIHAGIAKAVEKRPDLYLAHLNELG